MLFMSHTTASEKPWTPAVWTEIIYSHSYIRVQNLQKAKKERAHTYNLFRYAVISSLMNLSLKFH